jgi:hypothetical protein
MPQRDMEKGRDGAAPPLKMLDRKRGCAANAVLVAFIVTVPSMAILFGARSSASALWIGSANASRLGKPTVFHLVQSEVLRAFKKLG